MKAIALDLDGTVLNNAGEFPDSLKNTLQKIHDKGIKIIIATGRSLPMIKKKVPHDVPVDGYVGASGMTVYYGDELLSRTAFSESQVEFVLSEARVHEVYYEMTTSQHGGPYTFKEDKEYAERDLTSTQDSTVLEYENIGTIRTLNSTEQWVDSDAIDRTDIIKFYFFSNSKQKIDDWAEILHSKFTTDKGFQIYRTSDHNSETMVYGTDKGTGLTTLGKEMGIDVSEIHAFGDSMNDLPMFKVAGKSTAMLNGKENIKQAAHDVTTFDCDSDGLDHYLKEHYL